MSKNSHPYLAKVCKLFIMGILIATVGCSDDNGVGPESDPGLVEVVVRDSDGNVLLSPSLGALLINCSNVKIDAAKTEDANETFPLAVVHKDPAKENLYCILIVADDNQCSSDHIGKLYMSDRNNSASATVQVAMICSGDNEQLSPGDYSIALIRK